MKENIKAILRHQYPDKYEELHQQSADLILRLLDVVGQSKQLVAFLEFVVDYKMLEVDLEYEEIVKRFLGNG